MRCFAKILFLFAIGFPVSGLAGNISTVGSADVTKGEWEVAWRNAYGVDDDNTTQDGQWRTRFISKYGFTDDYALGIYLEMERFEGDAFSVDSLMIDNHLQFTEQKTDGYTSGMRVRYRFRNTQADTFDLRYLASTRLDAWELRTYQIIGHDVGGGAVSGVNLDSRFQLSHHFADFIAGIESFSDFGNLRTLNGFDQQSHYIGPVIRFSLHEGVSLEAAYHKGISDAAADHSLRLQITRSF